MPNKKKEIGIKKVIRYFDDRFYLLNENGKELYLPSSTTILQASPKPWLAQWRGSLGNEEADRIMNEALRKGSNVHDAIRVWINGGQIIYNDPKRPSYQPEELAEIISETRDSFLLREQQELLEVYRLIKWFEEINPRIIATEMTVFSMKYFFAGTLDLLIDIKEGKYNINGSKALELPAGRYIVDYKTGNSFDKKNYFRQVASYDLAAREQGEKIIGALIIHTNDNQIKGGIEGLKTYYVDREQLDKSFDEFLAIKKVYEIELSYEPKIIDLPTLLKREDKND